MKRRRWQQRQQQQQQNGWLTSVGVFRVRGDRGLDDVQPGRRVGGVHEVLMHD